MFHYFGRIGGILLQSADSGSILLLTNDGKQKRSETPEVALEPCWRVFREHFMLNSCLRYSLKFVIWISSPGKLRSWHYRKISGAKVVLEHIVRFSRHNFTLNVDHIGSLPSEFLRPANVRCRNLALTLDALCRYILWWIHFRVKSVIRLGFWSWNDLKWAKLPKCPRAVRNHICRFQGRPSR